MLQLELKLKPGSVGSELLSLPPPCLRTPRGHQAGGCSAWTQRVPEAKALLLQVMAPCVFSAELPFFGVAAGEV